MKISKNKLRTPGYFIKRLRDNGFIVLRVFSVYAKHDSRRWTVIVNPSDASVFITCYLNRENFDEILFELNDGGNRIPRNFSLKTDSIESVVCFLLEHGVSNNTDYPGKTRYLSKRINNYDERKETIQEASQK
jgi:hypothetical protein